MSCPIILSPVCAAGGAAADAGINALESALLDGFGKTIAITQTFWLHLPSPDYANSSAVHTLQDDLWVVTVGLAALNFILLGARLMWERHKGPADQMAKSVYRMIFAASILLPLVSAFTAAGHAYSNWVVSRSAGGQFGASVAGIVSALSTGVDSVGLLMLMGLLGILGGLAMILLMFAQLGATLLFASITPTAAAISGTEQGEHIYKKCLHWLMAFVLFPPVAATIYSGAYVAIAGDDLASAMAGWALMFLAIASMPVLIVALAPVAEHVTGMTLGGGAGKQVAQSVASGAGQGVGRALTSGGGKHAAGGVGKVTAVTQMSGKDSGPTGSGTAGSRPASTTTPQSQTAAGGTA